MLRNISLLSIFFLISAHVQLYAEPANLSLLKNEIVQYHDSGAYEKELASKINEVKSYLQKRVDDNQKLNKKQKLAIVLDIDETSLSNYEKMLRHGFYMNRAIFHQELLKSYSPAISPTLQLYQYALAHHVSVFFVTGRDRSEQEITEKNLHWAGYDHWTALYLRPDNYQQPSIIPFKSSMREQISKQGYTIIASIGDQLSDIQGGYAEKGCKLPNPFYYLP